MLMRARAAILMWWAARNGLIRQPAPVRRVAAADRAVALLRRSPTAAPPRLARALTVRGQCLLRAGRAAEAEAAAREALAIYGDVWGLRRADAHHMLAQALHALDRLDEAHVAAELAVSGYRSPPGPTSPRTTGRLAAALYTQGLILAQLHRHDEALLFAEESVRVTDAVPLLHIRWTLPTFWRARCHLVELLYRVGRYEEALRVGDKALEAVDLLVRVSPTSGRPFRARLLVYLARCHRQADDLDNAASVAEKAVADYRELGEEHRAGTAWALEIRADQLTALGRHGAADIALREAAQTYTSLADAEPDRYREDLYRVVVGRTNALWAAGDRDAAVALGFDFLPVLHSFAATDPDTYEPQLANGLAILAARASMLGRDDALEHADQALAIARRLADDKNYKPLLARCHHKRAATLMHLRRYAEAVDAARDAVQVRRRLVAAEPATHETDLALTLSLLGSLLYVLDRADEASVCLLEAAEMLRPHTDDPAQREQFADVLHKLGLAYSDLHRHAEAIDVLGESIEHQRRLLDRRQDVDHEASLAGSLRQRSFDSSAISRHHEAQTDIDEAVRIYRGLASAHPDRFLEELTHTEAQAVRQQAKRRHQPATDDATKNADST
jgi:tetratricopeptide (TPR) repeat protein